MTTQRSRSGFAILADNGNWEVAATPIEALEATDNIRIRHAWRDPHNGANPWSSPTNVLDCLATSPSLIQSTLSPIGYLELVAQVNDNGRPRLAHAWRDGLGIWRGPTIFNTPNDGGAQPAFIQGLYGNAGNFEVVAATGLGLTHYWRNNDALGPTASWQEASSFGGAARYDGVALIHSRFNNLEIVATRHGDGALMFSFKAGAGGPWAEPLFPIPGSAGCQGRPGFIHGFFGPVGNFEVVAPSSSGGLRHFWRDNSDPGMPWRETPAFGGTIPYQAVSLSQQGDHLEIFAQSGTQIHRYTGTAGAWTGPIEPTLLLPSSQITVNQAPRPPHDYRETFQIAVGVEGVITAGPLPSRVEIYAAVKSGARSWQRKLLMTFEELRRYGVEVSPNEVQPPSQASYWCEFSGSVYLTDGSSFQFSGSSATFDWGVAQPSPSVNATLRLLLGAPDSYGGRRITGANIVPAA